MSSQAWLTIIGIGEDGVDGLSRAARDALEAAETIIGGERHHDLSAGVTAERLAWPHPFDALIDEIRARRDRRVVILATGDPLWFSIGARITRSVPPEEIVFHPQLSAFQWAAARLGWSLADCETLTAHGRPAAQIVPWFWPGARLLVLTAGRHTPGEVARLLTEHGYGGSELIVLGALGGPRESRHEGRAADWAGNDPADGLPEFHTLAVSCIGRPEPPLPRVAGLPDDCFRHDGKMTKREVRAMTLARLMPARGAILWDIGTGCGSVAIEWMRAAPDAVALGIDPESARLRMARENADRLGAPRMVLIEGRAPDALDTLEPPAGTGPDLRYPDAIFVGGGLSEAVVDRALSALRPGGRLVANAVTLESESLLCDLHARHGGDLTRIAISRADPVGRLRGWRPAMPVTQWALLR